MLAIYLLWLIAAWIASVKIAINVAEAKGLDHESWGLAAFFFGPPVLLGLIGMPDRKLRSYIRSVAIKLEAIEEKEAVKLETKLVSKTAPSDQQASIYVSVTVKDRQKIMAAVFAQLTEQERAIASTEESDVMPGKMGFICSRDSKVILCLEYVGRKDGKHVWKRS